MKIDNISSNTNSVTGSNPLRINRSSDGVVQPRPSSNVQLSGQALDVNANTDSFDSAKVDEIRAAISEGRFQINPSAIADSLIQTARDLVQAQSKTA